MHKKLSHIILVFVGLLLSLVAMEIFLRIFSPQMTFAKAQAFSFKCFEEGEHRWVKLKKNCESMLGSANNSFVPVRVKTNSAGLRNPEIRYEKPAHTKRLLFIGDSFTMGWGVAEDASFPRLTETLLNKQGLAQKIESINAGFTAAGPSGYYLSLKLSGMKFDPDIVLVGFYLGNDILSRKDVAWVEVDAQGLPDVIRSKSSYVDYSSQLAWKDSPLKYRIPYLRQSHLFIFLMDTLYPQQNVSHQDELIEDTICVFDKDCHRFDEGKAEIKQLFLAMHTLLKEKGKRLVVVLIPTNFQVHFNVAYKMRYDLPVLRSERRLLNNEFLEFFDENGIDSVDLMPSLLAFAGENKLYFDRDDHWNETGHRVAAQAIAAKLTEYLR